jgi:hypothetical protein
LDIKKEKLQKILVKDTIKHPIRPKRHPLFGNSSITINILIKIKYIKDLFLVLRDRLNNEAINEAKNLRKNFDFKIKPNSLKRKHIEEVTDFDEDSTENINLKSEDAILNGYCVKIKFPTHLFIKKG